MIKLINLNLPFVLIEYGGGNVSGCASKPLFTLYELFPIFFYAFAPTKKVLCIEIKIRLNCSALEHGKNELHNAVLTIYYILQPNRWGLKKILQDYCYQLECQHAT